MRVTCQIPLAVAKLVSLVPKRENYGAGFVRTKKENELLSCIKNNQTVLFSMTKIRMNLNHLRIYHCMKFDDDSGKKFVIMPVAPLMNNMCKFFCFEYRSR